MVILKKERIKEGQILKACWLSHKELTGDTQVAFSQRLGFDQGQLQGWFTGKQPIPEDALLLMAAEMNFNPIKVRPALRDKALMIARLTQPEEAQDLERRLRSLEVGQLKELRSFLDYLESKSTHS